jgi:endonuclease I
MKKNLLNLMLLLIALAGLQATAAIPNGYYNTALGKSDRDLMLSLHQKIHGHYEIFYRNLWPKFQTTDCENNIIIDRYSDTQYTYQTGQCGAYNGLGDCYNREHSVPNSWWGGGKEDTDTMYSDLFHIYPVDGWVNAERGNYPFGDCANGSARGTGKLGRCTHSGYTGTVFEVADEYKGDFARTYFYMVVRYMHQVGTWTQGEGSAVFTNSSYKHLTPWAISQLLEWHRNDPVSALESKRNEAVYGIQHNRNPFIDHPELAEFLWGDRVGTPWTGSTSTDPVISSPSNGSTINVGTNTGNGVSKEISVKGVYLTKSVTVSVTGTGFSVTPTTLTAAAVNAGTTITVTYNGTAANATGRLTITSSEVTSNVTLTATYNTGGGSGGTETIETWEGCTGYGAYTTTFIQGAAFAWNTNNVGIWSGDPNANGSLSCRFGKNADSYIEMAEDVTEGASKVTFFAAKYGSDATATVQLQYSTNGGSTWTTVGTCQPNATWQQYIFNLDVTGNVRFKIAQTSGSRLNIDDIAITSNPGTVVINPMIDITAIDAMEAVQGEPSTVVRGTVSGVENSENITLMVQGNFEISLDRTTWGRYILMDPTGEVFYVRLADTGTVGEFDGTLTARTSQLSAHADVHGTVTPKTVTQGDVNMDGKCTIADVTVLINYLLSGSSEGVDVVAANVNGDDKVNISDVTALINLLLTGSSKMMTGWDAYPAEGGILVVNFTNEPLEVYNFDGDLRAVVVGNVKVKLPTGIYVVASDNDSRKVVVK